MNGTHENDPCLGLECDMTEEIDWDPAEKTTLALLWLTLHNGNRVWKQLDWEITDRLYEKGLIENPRTKAKSLVLTPQGMQLAERLFREQLLSTRHS